MNIPAEFRNFSPSSLLETPELQNFIKNRQAGLNEMPRDILEKMAGIIRSSTVLTGITFDGGVIAGADGQSTDTRGLEIADDQAPKLHQVAPHTVIGMTGSSAQCDELARIIEEVLRVDEAINQFADTPLTTEGTVGRVSMVVRQNLPLVAYYGLIAIPLLTTINKETGEGKVYHYDAVGGYSDATEGFWADGCGGPNAKGIFRGNTKDIAKGLSKDAAIMLTVHALAKTCHVNAGCGGKLLVKVITKQDGIVDVSQDRIAEICKELGPRVIGTYGLGYPYATPRE
ncbi:MAG: hypothetical protein Q7R73_00895 [bacterium]|nr:hypothetical protein [bacterium]